MKNKKLMYGAIGAAAFIAVIGIGVLFGEKSVEVVAPTVETTEAIESTEAAFVWEDIDMEPKMVMVTNDTAIHAEPRWEAAVEGDGVPGGCEIYLINTCEQSGIVLEGWHGFSYTEDGKKEGYVHIIYVDEDQQPVETEPVTVEETTEAVEPSTSVEETTAAATEAVIKETIKAAEETIAATKAPAETKAPTTKAPTTTAPTTAAPTQPTTQAPTQPAPTEAAGGGVNLEGLSKGDINPNLGETGGGASGYDNPDGSVE